MAQRTLFKPINEVALEHLVSHPEVQKRLKLRYVGSVINETGDWLPSPDCFMVDENDNNRLVRCEFKKSPSTYLEFKDNGKFEIAIIWSLANTNVSLATFKRQLEDQNRCEKIIVLTDDQWFRDLPDYTMAEINKTLNIAGKKFVSKKDELIKKIRNFKRHESIYTAYVASKLYPDGVNTDRLIVQVREAFQLPVNADRKADGNIYNALTWVKPPMLIKKNRGNFIWNEYYNVENGTEVIRGILKELLDESKIPNDATINDMKIASPR